MPFSDHESQARRILRDLSEHEREREGSPEAVGPGDRTPPKHGLARYELRERIGEGSTSIVHSAWDLELQRPVAIKILRDIAGLSEIARIRFRREAQAAAGLAHPNVVAVYDTGEEGEKLFIVMELVEGRSLSTILKEGGTSEDEVVAILEKAARGVAAAHAKGVVHRDLKPSNILIKPDGEPKVGDFGLAFIVDSTADLTRTGTVLGTPLYMAPEQVEPRIGKVTARSDVYALGALLYEVVTGRPPHSGETTFEIYAKVLQEDVIPPRQVNPRVPLQLETIILKALEREPVRRYADAAELANDLRRYLEGARIEARRPGIVRRWIRGIRRYPNVAALVVMALLVIATAAWGWSEVRARAYRQAYRDGMGLWSRRDMGRAMEGFRRASELVPDRAEPWLMMGRCARSLGKDAEAVRCWTEALERNPELGPALFERGRHVLQAWARRRVPPSVGERPGWLWFAPALPEDATSRVERQKARSDLAAARDLDPADRIYAEAGMAFLDGRYAEAAAGFQKYVERHPWDGRAVGLLGLTCYYNRDLDGAERWLTEAIRAGEDRTILRARGDVRYLAGRYEAAYADYAEAGAPGTSNAAFEVPVRGLCLRLRADAGGAPGEGPVMRWVDVLKAGQAAVQEEPGRAPLRVEGVVRFDGVDDFLRLPAGFADFTAGMSAFVVARPEGAALRMGFFELGSGLRNDNIVFGRGDAADALSYRVYVGDTAKGSAYAREAMVPGEFQSFGVVAQPDGRVALYRNGAPAGTGTSSIPSQVTRTANFIGCASAQPGDVFFKGDLAEVLIYARALDDADRERVLEYLKQTYFAPLPEPAGPPAPAGTGTGLQARYCMGTEVSRPMVSRIDPGVDFDWGVGSPDPSMKPDAFSARWSGQVEACRSGLCRFHVVSSDAVRLWVDGRLVINNWTSHALVEDVGRVSLVAGRRYDLVLEFAGNGGAAAVRLLWSGPGLAEEVVPKNRLYPCPVGANP